MVCNRVPVVQATLSGIRELVLMTSACVSECPLVSVRSLRARWRTKNETPHARLFESRRRDCCWILGRACATVGSARVGHEQ